MPEAVVAIPEAVAARDSDARGSDSQGQQCQRQ